MLNEHHPLRSYSTAESDLDIAADPLIFLGCGHVIHMTTMDQYMSLDDVYSKDGQGHWAAPSPLGAEKKAVKTCPLCRQPLSQVMRHGRILNKMKIDQADIKFAGQCNMLLDNADSLFQQAVAATEQVDQLGGQAAVQPPPARLPQHRLPRQRAQQQQQYPDAKLEAILHARRLADRAVDAFEAMEKACRRPPTVAVHESTQATLQRLVDREALCGASSSPVGFSAQETHVPRPDKRPECKAQIGLCQSNSLWSSVNVKLMQHKTSGHPP